MWQVAGVHNLICCMSSRRTIATAQATCRTGAHAVRFATSVPSRLSVARIGPSRSHRARCIRLRPEQASSIGCALSERETGVRRRRRASLTPCQCPASRVHKSAPARATESASAVGTVFAAAVKRKRLPSTRHSCQTRARTRSLFADMRQSPSYRRPFVRFP